MFIVAEQLADFGSMHVPIVRFADAEHLARLQTAQQIRAGLLAGEHDDGPG